LAALALAAMQTAVTAKIMTLQSLIDDGYTIAGVFSSRTAAAGLFLQ
jgi:hypothetical protein